MGSPEANFCPTATWQIKQALILVQTLVIPSLLWYCIYFTPVLPWYLPLNDQYVGFSDIYTGSMLADCNPLVSASTSCMREKLSSILDYCGNIKKKHNLKNYITLQNSLMIVYHNWKIYNAQHVALRAADWWKPGHSSLITTMALETKWTISSNVHKHGVHTSFSAMPGRQNHLLCCFSQPHVHSSEEVNVLFSVIKLLRFS